MSFATKYAALEDLTLEAYTARMILDIIQIHRQSNLRSVYNYAPTPEARLQNADSIWPPPCSLHTHVASIT